MIYKMYFTISHFHVEHGFWGYCRTLLLELMMFNLRIQCYFFYNYKYIILQYYSTEIYLFFLHILIVLLQLYLLVILYWVLGTVVSLYLIKLYNYIILYYCIICECSCMYVTVVGLGLGLDRVWVWVSVWVFTVMNYQMGYQISDDYR